MNNATPNLEHLGCADVEAALQTFLDGNAVDLVAATSAHCAVCLNCRDFVRAATHLQRTIPLLPRAAANPAVVDRIVAAVMADSVASRRAPFDARRVWIWAAIAASLLLTAGALTIRLWPVGPQLPLHSAPDFAHVKPETPPALRDQLADAGTAVVSLTRRTADQAVEPTRKLFPDGLGGKSLDVVGQLPKTMDPAVQSLQQVRQGAESGFEPVAHSARRALSMFLDMPPLERDRKPDF